VRCSALPTRGSALCFRANPCTPLRNGHPRSRWFRRIRAPGLGQRRIASPSRIANGSRQDSTYGLGNRILRLTRGCHPGTIQHVQQLTHVFKNTLASLEVPWDPEAPAYQMLTVGNRPAKRRLNRRSLRCKGEEKNESRPVKAFPQRVTIRLWTLHQGEFRSPAGGDYFCGRRCQDSPLTSDLTVPPAGTGLAVVT
jgi:hypothetical protein